MKRYTSNTILGKGLLLFLALFMLYSCEPEIPELKKKSDQLVISDYIARDSVNFSEFNALLVNTKLDGFLAIRGPYTLFLPNNTAMKAYYAEKGISSASALTIDEQIELVYNHLILAEISAGDIGLGSIRETNALGDKMATEFVFNDATSDVLINKTAIIVDRDIRAANGYIHEIDKVIEPLKSSLMEILNENPQLSLFTKGLELTGISDTLNMIDFQYSATVSKRVRNNFTILAVPDSIFNRYGISTIDDMIKYFTDEPGKVKNVDNGFYQFMEYHCLNGTYFFSDFDTKLYPILSFNNNVLLTIDDDYKINNSSLTDLYTGFLTDFSNVPAKNGALHVINDLLPVITPEPTEIIFDTCEQFEMMQGDFYKKYYYKWYDGQNTFKNIKFEGDYLQYYYKDHDAPIQINYDGLQMIGYWWVEVTTPKVMKGKYTLTGFVWGGRVCDVYVDGVKTAHIRGSDPDKHPWGEFEWDETKEHKIKMVARAFSTIFWDTIELTPVTE